MKTIILLLAATIGSVSLFAQRKRVPASAGRQELIEIEKDVKHHVTDIGDGQPLVLIHGWHKGINNSYIVKFENSGHALFIEEEEKCNSELEKFAKK
jgi:hypothetical protein